MVIESGKCNFVIGGRSVGGREGWLVGWLALHAILPLVNNGAPVWKIDPNNYQRGRVFLTPSPLPPTFNPAAIAAAAAAVVGDGEATAVLGMR